MKNRKRDIELGLYLKSKREAANLTQSQVAKFLGYECSQFISNIERGLCAPPLDALKGMNEIYDLSSERVINIYTRGERELLESAFL